MYVTRPLLRLAAPEIGIKAVRPYEARVVAALDDPPPIEHQDLVGGHDTGQAVRDHDRRGTFGDCGEIGLDRLLGGAVEGRRRLVEDEDARALEDRAGNRQTLLFAAGQLEAALADQGGVAVRQGVDEALKRRGCGGGVDLRGTRVRTGERDVLADRVVEQHGVLRHHRDRGPDARLSQLADVLAIDQNAAGAWIIETEQQPGDARFAGAGRADDRNLAARLDGEAHVVERAASGAVVEGDALEGHRSRPGA
jgi:hypothetical protein